MKSFHKFKDDLKDRWSDSQKLRATAKAIRKNTHALSKLSTNPPKEEQKMSTPGEDVAAALAEQTDAIATLSAELADEHAEWVKAVEAGDTGQAEAIVAQVKENTASLKALSDNLASSHPGSNPEPTPTPQ